MQPFLKSVAKAYLLNEKEQLLDYCFVFPNKRSAAFFRYYLSVLARETRNIPVLSPQTITLDELMESLSGAHLAVASRYDQLFTLFSEYRRLSGADVEFDRFRYWGDMLLGDFDEVDRHLVDPRMIFDNISHLSEIRSNYLTPRQRELISRYLGHDYTALDENGGADDDEMERFWQHVPGEGAGEDGSHKMFVKLWALLAPLYQKFTEALEKEHLATRGRLYRLAVERLKEGDTEGLSAERYIFVGFNLLSASELLMFKRLMAMRRADFYWDLNSPALRSPQLTGNLAQLLHRSVEMFPSRYEIDEPEIVTFPDIEIVGVPSKTLQPRFAGQVLEQLMADGYADRGDRGAINTAVVLPDESLLEPMLLSIPPVFEKVNVTMGIPVRQTTVASLLRRIVRLRQRASKNSAGESRYYYVDVLSIASHPLLRTVAPSECEQLQNAIQRDRIFDLTPSRLAELAPSFVPVFAEVGLPGSGHDFAAVKTYFAELLDFLERSLAHQSEEATEDAGRSMAHSVLKVYRSALEQLAEAATRFRVSMGEKTVFHLIESAISSTKVTFDGEPLEGLQVMGVLETRALDFDNVVMLSMNERVFPRRMQRPSFIPEAIRHGYGLPTAHLRDAIYAYHFFRLIARARRVTLLYDSRTAGARPGGSGPSRYIAWMLYLFPRTSSRTLRHSSLVNTQSSLATTQPLIAVSKTPRVMEILKSFTDPDSTDKRFLSPSAINTYINCPLLFYLQYVEGMKQPDELTDYVDASTYGRIVHEVMENLYELQRTEDGSDPLITADDIRLWIENPHIIRRLITQSLNRLYRRLPEGAALDTPLSGDAYALGRLIEFAVKGMLRQEIPAAPFTFVAAEKQEKMSLPLGPDLAINLNLIIDRVDRVLSPADGSPSRLRIVDYKTGEDKPDLPADPITAMFDSSLPSRPKAALQLMLYCNVYAASEHTDEPIQPLIYRFRDAAINGINPITYNTAPGSRQREVLLDYHVLNDEFMQRLRDTIREMLDPHVPFTTAAHPHSCTFCHFRALCGDSQDK